MPGGTTRSGQLKNPNIDRHYRGGLFSAFLYFLRFIIRSKTFQPCQGDREMYIISRLSFSCAAALFATLPFAGVVSADEVANL